MFRSQTQSLLDQELNSVLRELKHHGVDSEEYAKILDSAVTLHKMREVEKSSYVSKDTLAVIAANLLGIFMVIKHENVNVITSRAMNLLMKPDRSI